MSDTIKASRRGRIGRTLTFVPVVAGVVGLLLHFTIRDRVPVLAVLFYGLPPAVVVALFAASALIFLRRRRRCWTVVSSVALIAAVVVWIQTDYIRGNTSGVDLDGDTMRLVVWNLGRPSGRDERFLPTLKDVNGQIVVLVESGYERDHPRSFWESHFPDDYVAMLERGITLLSRYPIVETHVHVVGNYTRIAVCDLLTPSGAISVLAVDIDSNPFLSRKPAIDRIYEIARSKPNPVAILGDFNTPHTSALFADLYRSFQQAFVRAGNGWITTWPAFCPALALDHIWLSDDFIVAHAATRRRFCSDHALVMADVMLTRPQARQPQEGGQEL
jgi:endonuclease/exonuclease/phosphatase family metal-dependent hydrolase